MAVTFRSVGADTVSATDPTGAPGAPAGQLASDMLIYLVLTRLAAPPTANAPTGFTAPSGNTGTGGAGSFGIDSGLVRITMFYREATANGEAMPTCDLSAAPNVSQVMVLCYSKAADEIWSAPVCAIGSDTTASTTLYDPAVATPTIDLGVGDRLCWADAINGDAGTPTTPGTVTVAGVTFVSINHRDNQSTTTGNDSRLICGDALYDTGTASAGPDRQVSWASGGTNMAGVTVFWRLRVTQAEPAALPILVMPPPRRSG